MSPSASTILFADVAGSSRLYKKVGDARAQEMVAAALAEMTLVIERQNGRVIKTIGDEVMSRFEDATAGIEAAIGIQQLRAPGSSGLPVRIGVHHGSTVEVDDDIFGEAVNDAAALVRIARGGQIITSAETVGRLPDRLKEKALPFDLVKLKGSAEASIIYTVRWESDEKTDEGATQLLPVATQDQRVPGSEVRLEIHCGDRHVSLRPDQTPFVVGRDPSVAHLPVVSTVASRDHFRIDYRRGKFVLSDNSTNGTWVRLASGETLYLRREELPLSGQGVISVGQFIDPADPNLIRFSL